MTVQVRCVDALLLGCHAEAMLDLSAYLARIGLPELNLETPPTLAMLDALICAHVQTVPFENLDVLLGRRIDLDLGAIEHKLVHARRGGYCFEQNTFFCALLSQLGFTAELLSARVRYQRPRSPTPPRTHVFLRVTIEGVAYLADVGVGAISPTCALRLDTEDEQPTPHEVRRIVREGGLFVHQVRFGDAFHDVCEFTGEEMPAIDREVGNWFTSTHPDSVFKQRLMVARALPAGRRVTLLNHELTLRDATGASETQRLDTQPALLSALKQHFDLDFPSTTHFTCPGLSFF